LEIKRQSAFRRCLGVKGSDQLTNLPRAAFGAFDFLRIVFSDAQNNGEFSLAIDAPVLVGGHGKDSF
jgi:hypothetical protein